MIVIPKLELVLVTPPKTASKSVRQAICGLPDLDAYEVCGPVVGGRISSHTTQIPDDYVTARIALLVRHPLDRIVSLWQHATRSQAYQGLGSVDFSSYVRELAGDQHAHSVFGRTIAHLTEELPVRQVVHVECLEADLRSLGIPVESPLPQLDRSFRKPWPNYYDPETKSAASQWAREDFDRFGYVENGLARDRPAPEYLNPVKVVSDREKLVEVLPSGGIAAEIGVFAGDFSSRILALNKPRCLHLIDHWPSDETYTLDQTTLSGTEAFLRVRERFQSEIDAKQVVLHRQSSLTALAALPDGHLDWVYLDGSHFFYDVFAELCLCHHKVKPGGFICGHDYCPVFDHGVVRAVEVFCKQFGYELVYLTNEEPEPALFRFGINASVPERVAYNSFALRRQGSAR